MTAAHLTAATSVNSTVSWAMLYFSCIDYSSFFLRRREGVGNGCKVS